MKTYITSVQKQFRYYKLLGEKTIAQLSDVELFQRLNAKRESLYSNSIAIIVKHITGNMLSRWTHVYEEDGEKEWRNREGEFEETIKTREDLMAKWDEGWACLLNVLDNLEEDDLERVVYIRNMGHSMIEAINRQMMHYAYHIGQIVLIGKEFKGDEWKSLSIPLGDSQKYNDEKFGKEAEKKHFTDDL